MLERLPDIEHHLYRLLRGGMVLAELEGANPCGSHLDAVSPTSQTHPCGVQGCPKKARPSITMAGYLNKAKGRTRRV